MDLYLRRPVQPSGLDSKGFAHGFYVLSDYAVVQYKCTAPWNKLSENIIDGMIPDLI